MIKKLRNKFIFINMCFVTAILFAISAFLSVSYYQRNTRNSTFFLENELRRVMQGNSQDRTASAPQPFSAGGDRNRNSRSREQDRDRIWEALRAPTARAAMMMTSLTETSEKSENHKI